MMQRDWLNLEEDVMAEIPDLPHVTDLTVEVSSPGRHAFGAGVANLLARCVNLQRLRVDLVDGVSDRSIDLEAPAHTAAYMIRSESFFVC